MAKKTIAIRECDGLYDCCIAAVDGFESFDEFAQKFHDHTLVHSNHVCAESHVQRLWTLQECLLSHTIEFVIGTDNRPKKPAVRAQAHDDIQFYRHQIERTILSDALWVLAFSFSGSRGNSAINEFLKAYVHGGTVVNPRSVARSQDEDIHSGQFLQVNRASHRATTMSRDYIFATMPSFPWYTYPKKEALSMSFGEIYLDLYRQAARSGHAFTCRFTRSMLDPACTDPTTGWLPSQHLPSPTTLGDFLKLVGQRVPEASQASSRHVHITSIVQIEEFDSRSTPDSVICMLEANVKSFRMQWEESHRGGELSKYGNYPNHRWKLDPSDAMNCGWRLIDLDHATRVYDHVNHTPTEIMFEEDDLPPDVSNLEATEEEARTHEAGSYTPLFVQARKILDHMWCAHDIHYINAGQQADWNYFKRQMQGSWSAPLLRTMLLLTAMLNCRVPLSAAAWVNRLFIPVYIHHGDLFVSIGLLAKHARKPKEQREESRSLLCVGQHAPLGDEQAFGKDLFLVDAETRVPVGLVPDVMPDVWTNEEIARLAVILYQGFCGDAGGGSVAVAICSLEDY